MIAYNKIWLDNVTAQASIGQALEEKAITAEEYAIAGKQYPCAFYTPNFFIRIGMFILTNIVCSCAFGFMSLIMLNSIEKVVSTLFFLFSMAAYAALEFFVRTKHHYRSGVDDALMWTSGGCFIAGIAIAADLDMSMASISLLVMFISTYFTLRFADMLMAAIAVLASLSVVFFTYLHAGTIAKTTMPFVIMLISAIIYFAAKKISISYQARHYVNCLIVIQATMLVTFYAAGNYFVVRELSNGMFDLGLKEGETIPFGWLFWIFTIVVPVGYITRGLQKKDVVLLRVGLLLIVAIVFTIHNYHHILTVETLMVAGGISLVFIAWSVTRWLSVPKKGFTSAESNSKYLLDKMNVESLVIAQTFSGTGIAPEKRFGGGSAGGSGASGDF